MRRDIPNQESSFAIEICFEAVYLPAPNTDSCSDGVVPALQTPVVVIHVRLLAFSEPHNKQQRLYHSLPPPRLVQWYLDTP